NYITTGRRVEGQPCTYEFFSNSSHKSKSGKFFSPFYPQIYKRNSRCRYHLHALPGERVRVVFSNIQLHNRDTSCYNAPDVVTVYDGEDTDSNVIAQYCGFHNNEEIISFTNQMLVVFSSDSRLQEQGFSATYQFIGKTPAATNPRFIKNSTKVLVVPVGPSRYNLVTS
ncbi:bone morphogenetic protein 1-like, partial [Littorina saxatilis]|uniref:bone morphogenetic protein 1-like n=1 Tax=Littorina saxatilis TaxID=31220 RepID=UPI0038B54C3D